MYAIDLSILWQTKHVRKAISEDENDLKYYHLLLKVYAKIAAGCLILHRESTRFLRDSQSPNRKFHSGETATMKIISDWRVALNKETSLHMTEHSMRLIIKVCSFV
jgi:hypothetical protein